MSLQRHLLDKLIVLINPQTETMLHFYIHIRAREIQKAAYCILCIWKEMLFDA